MRELADSTHIEKFMRELGRAVQVEGRVYLTGGATAVLYGWRDTTIDVDIKLIPDRDEILREIPRLKEKLDRRLKQLGVDLDALGQREHGGSFRIGRGITRGKQEPILFAKGDLELLQNPQQHLTAGVRAESDAGACAIGAGATRPRAEIESTPLRRR